MLLILFNNVNFLSHGCVSFSHKLSAVLIYLCVRTYIDAKHHLFLFRKHFQNLLIAGICTALFSILVVIYVVRVFLRCVKYVFFPSSKSSFLCWPQVGYFSWSTASWIFLKIKREIYLIATEYKCVPDSQKIIQTDLGFFLSEF